MPKMKKKLKKSAPVEAPKRRGRPPGSKNSAKAAPAKRGRKPGQAVKPQLSIAGLHSALFGTDNVERADAVKRYPNAAVAMLTAADTVFLAMDGISARKLENMIKDFGNPEAGDTEEIEETPVKRGPGRPKKVAAPVEVEADDSDDEEDDEEEEAPAPKKRGRPAGSKNKPAKAAKKSKADEDEDEDEDEDDIAELLGDDEEEDDEDSEEEDDSDDSDDEEDDEDEEEAPAPRRKKR